MTIKQIKLRKAAAILLGIPEDQVPESWWRK